MQKEIIINCSNGETRAAILEDRKVVELLIERSNHERVVGNIYKGRVENVLPGMSAAFVNIGLEKNAFLYFDDAIHQLDDEEYKLAVKSHSIRDWVKEGQDVIVQVTKEPIGTKGARVTTQLSVAGRYLVLMPTVNYIGISRRITDSEERNRLKQIASKVRPKDMGLIVRTVAEGKGEKELKQDVDMLLRVWRGIKRRARLYPAPSLIYKDHDLVFRIVRDIFSNDFEKLIVDSRSEYEKILDVLEVLAPNLRSRVYYYHEGIPIFDFYGVEREIEAALKSKVWLPSGGYLVIDQTEALTSIDVNTGKYTGSKNLEDTVLRTNLEAAEEIARQLRLRDIGGIIIIDFIDMDSKEDEAKVLAKLQEATSRERTKTHVIGFTSLGMVEMTRKKVRENIADVLQQPCPYCYGTGRVLSDETLANQAERKIMEWARRDGVGGILVEAHPQVAAKLIGAGGANLRRLEKETNLTIYVKGRNSFHFEQVEITPAQDKQELQELALPVKEGQVLDVEVEGPHSTHPQNGISRLDGYVVDIEGAGNCVGKKLKVEITKVFRTYAKGKVLGG